MSQFDAKAGSPFSGIPAAGKRAGTLEEKRAAAEAQGYRVVGDKVITGTLGPAPTYRPLEVFDPFRAQGITALDQAGAALGQDIEFLKQNVLGPYQDASAGFEQALGGIGAIGEAGATSIGELTARAGQVAGTQADVVGGIRKAGQGYGPVLDALNEDLDAAIAGAAGQTQDVAAIAKSVENGLADAAKLIKDSIATGKSAIKNFRADTARTVQAVVSGLDARTKNASRLLDAGVDPNTGQKLSGSALRAAKSELRRETGMTIAQSAASIHQEASQFVAGLRTNLANLQQSGAATLMEGEKVRLGAGQLTEQAAARESQVRLAAAEQRAGAGMQAVTQQQAGEVAAGQAALAFEGLRNDLFNAIASLRSTSALETVQLDLQGRTQYAELLRNTPFVSMFEGLAGMLALATAPGGRSIRPLRLA